MRRSDSMLRLPCCRPKAGCSIRAVELVVSVAPGGLELFVVGRKVEQSFGTGIRLVELDRQP